jgi:putrescine transport system permease protein
MKFRDGKSLIVATPYTWLIIFCLVPFVIVLLVSMAVAARASPPFEFLQHWPYLQWDSYRQLAQDPLFFRALLTSLCNAGIATIVCLLIGYPMALALTRMRPSWRTLFLMLLILPFWTSFLLRVYAWIGLMGNQSWFNKGLTSVANLILPGNSASFDSLQLMNTNFAVIVVMAYCYLPFMVLPLYANLAKLDVALDEAALDLGAKPRHVFFDVTLPLSIPGIIAGGLLVFIPASGELIIPSLVGSAADPMLGRVINDQVFTARDWPVASAMAITLLVILIIPFLLHHYYTDRIDKKSELIT